MLEPYRPALPGLRALSRSIHLDSESSAGMPVMIGRTLTFCFLASRSPRNDASLKIRSGIDSDWKFSIGLDISARLGA